jgi:PadR family transcriptional regulator AphA
MEYQLVEMDSKKYVECLPGALIASDQDALDLVAACAENQTQRLMLHAENLPAEFFDLKTGLAGAVLLKFVNYRIQVAAVLTPEVIGSGKFREMALESTRGPDFRVFFERAKAEAWLLSI